MPVVALVDRATADAPPLACYAYLQKPVAPFVLAQTLRNACEHARLRREAEETRRQLEELNPIGVRLTAERDTDALLELILTKAREITRSDAGSLYLVEEPDARRAAPLQARPERQRAGALHRVHPADQRGEHRRLRGPHRRDRPRGRRLCLPAGSRFRVNRDFDTQVGYRTKSMLVVPMRTPTGEVIGVLQLINCKRDIARPFASPEAVQDEALPYPARFRDLAASLASQAAVALENSRLYDSIQTLFEGFVQASVTAIESRDPTTSGHSFRVADLTVALATAVDRAPRGPFRDVRFSTDEMKEIRYASLLHDFGKVGVREEVLVKAKKLQPWHLELIRQRAEIIKRGLELKLRAAQARPARRGRAARALPRQPAAWDAELACLLDEIDRHFKAVAAANEPAILPEDCDDRVRSLALRTFVDHLGEPQTLITPDEAAHPLDPARQPDEGGVQADPVPRGPHVPVPEPDPLDAGAAPHSRDRALPPREARRLRLPAGQARVEIPLQTRMMTISDIFDALTATDRPYKAAVPVERALDILDQEAKAGALDPAPPRDVHRSQAVERPQALSFIGGGLDGPLRTSPRNRLRRRSRRSNTVASTRCYPMRSAASSPHDATAASMTKPADPFPSCRNAAHLLSGSSQKKGPSRRGRSATFTSRPAMRPRGAASASSPARACALDARGLLVSTMVVPPLVPLACPYMFRSTPTTLPRIRKSPRSDPTTIGFIVGCSGRSTTASPSRAKRFTVASPSIRAATMSFGSADS